MALTWKNIDQFRKINDQDPQELRLTNVDGIIHATRNEVDYIWGDLNKFNKWEDIGPELFYQVGTLSKRSICISIMFAIINGKRYAFWHPTSQLVDYKIIDAFWSMFDAPKGDASEYGWVIQNCKRE